MFNRWNAEGSLHNPTIFAGVKKPICDVALEYLDIVKSYPCPLAYARGHMFKMLHKVYVILIGRRQLFVFI